MSLGTQKTIKQEGAS